MLRRYPLIPRVWLMSDERLGDGHTRDGLLTAVARLPRGAGVVFRHYSLTEKDREALFARVQGLARGRGLHLVLAGSPGMARRWRAAGSHGRAGKRRPEMARSLSVHSFRELAGAKRMGAHIIFISPVFPTRSHIGAASLGGIRFALLAHHARHLGLIPIALGGMTARRARALPHAYGWAGIDAFR